MVKHYLGFGCEVKRAVAVAKLVEPAFRLLDLCAQLRQIGFKESQHFFSFCHFARHVLADIHRADFIQGLRNDFRIVAGQAGENDARLTALLNNHEGPLQPFNDRQLWRPHQIEFSPWISHGRADKHLPFLSTYRERKGSSKLAIPQSFTIGRNQVVAIGAEADQKSLGLKLGRNDKTLHFQRFVAADVTLHPQKTWLGGRCGPTGQPLADKGNVFGPDTQIKVKTLHGLTYNQT